MELSIEERTRTDAKDEQTADTMRMLINWIKLARQFNQLPYANNMAYRLGDLQRSAECVLEECACVKYAEAE